MDSLGYRVRPFLKRKKQAFSREHVFCNLMQPLKLHFKKRKAKQTWILVELKRELSCGTTVKERAPCPSPTPLPWVCSGPW